MKRHLALAFLFLTTAAHSQESKDPKEKKEVRPEVVQKIIVSNEAILKEKKRDSKTGGDVVSNIQTKLSGGTKTPMKEGSGSNIGGGTTGSEFETSKWCKGQHDLMSEYLKNASKKYVETSDDEGTIKLLVEGVIKAYSLKADKSTLTYQILDWYLLVLNQVDVISKDATEHKQQFTRQLLGSFYNLLLSDVASIDTKSIVPMLERKASSDVAKRPTVEEMSKVLADGQGKFVMKQIEWLHKSFVYLDPMEDKKEDKKTKVFPQDEASTYFTAVKLLTQKWAHSLNETGDKKRFACSINAFLTIGDKLEKYTQGNDEIYRSDEAALNSVYNELNGIFIKMTQSEKCYN